MSVPGVTPPLPRSAPPADRTIALFLAGLLLFSPPLLRVFGVGGTVFGLPLLAVYVFVAWTTVIALAAFHLERGGRG